MTPSRPTAQSSVKIRCAMLVEYDRLTVEDGALLKRIKSDAGKTADLIVFAGGNDPATWGSVCRPMRPPWARPLTLKSGA